MGKIADKVNVIKKRKAESATHFRRIAICKYPPNDELSAKTENPSEAEADYEQALEDIRKAAKRNNLSTIVEIKPETAQALRKNGFELENFGYFGKNGKIMYIANW